MAMNLMARTSWIAAPLLLASVLACARGTGDPPAGVTKPVETRAPAGAAEDDDNAEFDAQAARIALERGLVLADGGNYEEAVSELDHAITLDPGLARAYEAAGAAHFELGDTGGR